MTSQRDPQIPTGTHCEWCGAEFDADALPVEDKPPAKKKTLKVRVATSEPPTHCEFCGVEYPTPQSSPDST